MFLDASSPRRCSALLLGVPTLRLRADYLAIVTIAAGEIIRLVLRAARFRETTGGAAGIQNFADDFFDLNPFAGGRYGFDIPGTDIGVTTPATRSGCCSSGWSLVALACLFVYLLVRSPWGRVLKAIREDEDAVRSLGKNVYGYKMQCLVIGGVIGAHRRRDLRRRPPVGGARQPRHRAHVLRLHRPRPRRGRPGARPGGRLDHLLLPPRRSSTSRCARRSTPTTSTSSWPTRSASSRNILVGVGLMVLMIFRPQGIFGDKREVAVSVRR